MYFECGLKILLDRWPHSSEKIMEHAVNGVEYRNRWLVLYGAGFHFMVI
jgi:hypothetical protein